MENLDDALPDFEGLFDGLGDAREEVFGHDEAIDDDFDVVALIFVELGEFVQCVNDAVDAGAGEAFGEVLVGDVGEGAFFVRN